MIRTLLNLTVIFIYLPICAQPDQLNLTRVDQMPDKPTPLQIRDWKSVAQNYDNYIFDLNKTGQFFPLSSLGTTGQYNYPDNTPIYLDSYVGSVNHLDNAEAINLMPAIIGASLLGIDKSNQFGINWVTATKDFFNLKNNQNVYLNNYSTSSGNDWWYDLMPNVYFYQLKWLYPDADPEFITQFTTIADRWLYCINQLDGSITPWTIPNMNYRAFNLITGLPLTTGVPEPESAGSISWILYNAYLETGKRKYFEGAQLSMDYLVSLQSNPSYELQLPYGTIAAARMNAIEGTNYPLQKLLEWCFNRGDLRGWGAIVGNWGGFDVSGLIGEANDAGGDYAFIMNGFQQAAALAPLPKYDKRYARSIAKWILNLNNASRLFYWNALPQSQQDSYAWASVNDPTACIPYESMKELWEGKTPFATGDAISGGWAATNLSLYSGSSVGYLAAIVQKTNIPEILQIDLNITDFYGENSLVSYLYFNPLLDAQMVDVVLPPGTYGVYDAISETVLFPSASGTIQISIPAGEVRLIRLYSSILTPVASNGKLYAGTDILDYHFGYDYSENLRIKALATDKNPVLTNSTFTAYCEPGNIASGDFVQFEWYLDDVLLAGKTTSNVNITAPISESQTVLKCKINLNGQTSEDTLNLQIIDHIPLPPVVNGIESASKYIITGETSNFTALVEPGTGEILTYNWSTTSGILIQNEGISVSWQAPLTPGIATITLKVSNQDMLSTSVSIVMLVKDTSIVDQTPLIWYPFDYDNLNAISNQYHASVSGASKTADARNMESLAYRFTSGQNIIYTDNDANLNFTNALSLCCWVKCEQFGTERFIFSHGSWQERYKLSITPTGFLRWTIKTSTGVADLDGSAPIELNKYYHITVLYTGYSMEIYVDGVLDSFKEFSGSIQTSTKPITIGRMNNTETLYSLLGSVDEFRLWDKEIPIHQIEELKNQWATSTGIVEVRQIMNIYPNPAESVIYIELKDNKHPKQIAIFNMNGKEVSNYKVQMQNSGIIVNDLQTKHGMHFLRIIMDDGTILNKKIIIN